MANVLINPGTTTAISTDVIGTLNYQIVKVDVGNLGSSVPWQGTVTVNAIGTLNHGTIDKGTISTGTVDTISQFPPNNWATVINTGTSTVGTLKAGVGGSQIYITDLIISAGTITNFVLGNGTITNPLTGTLSFNQYGGLMGNFRIPLIASTGSAIVYQQSANNTLSITAQGGIK